MLFFDPGAVFLTSCWRICLDSLRTKRVFLLACLLTPLFLAATVVSAQGVWTTVGPAGGDARSFATVPGQPNHLYLGTTNSWIYESTDGGSSWHRLSKLNSFGDLIVDHIVVDAGNPALVYVAGWTADRPNGGLWESHDGGRQWTEIEGLHGQSIRAFAQAPSNPEVLFAGTLQGVFRSNDGGASWTQISPPGSREIHEVESLAVDPANPDIIYAGTWHLPWKTTDGGKAWHNIKKGVIDDSDVFSIIVDPAHSHIVYASACSGIYKSENAGELFHKIQGIPATARRTRVLKQDSLHPEVVYAGTTEGLYKTVNGGRTFKRMTGPDVIVNDVFIDPKDSSRVLLATDRGGVLASEDGSASFAAANEGFSERKVEALLVDRGNPARIFAGVVNDKSYGSVFVSDNGGTGWHQLAGALDGRDVFVLAQAQDGTILAGTNDGIFALKENAPSHPDGKDTDRNAGKTKEKRKDAGKGEDLSPRTQTIWEPRDTIANTLTKTSTETHHGERVNVEKHVAEARRRMGGRVYALDLSGDTWLASTAGGVFTSKDNGATWQGGPVMGVTGYLAVAVHGPVLAAARPDGVVVSNDSGESWWPIGIPTVLTRIHRIAYSPDGTLWLGAREGIYFTRDKGKSWMWIKRLPFVDVDDVYYDAQLDRVLVSSRSSDFVYAIDTKTLDWKWWQTGYRLSAVRSASGHLLAASLYDGVLVEPQPRAAVAEAGRGR